MFGIMFVSKFLNVFFLLVSSINLGIIIICLKDESELSSVSFQKLFKHNFTYHYYLFYRYGDIIILLYEYAQCE